MDASSIRVADSDREQLAEELREHMVAGRLTPEEFEERIHAAYAAKTRAELDALGADLPMGLVRVNSALARRRAKLKRRLLQEGGGALGIFALCTVIWLLTGAGEGAPFWPAWVLFATMIPVVRNAWRLFGPAPDPDSVERHLDRQRRRREHHEERRDRRRHHGPPRPPRPPHLSA